MRVLRGRLRVGVFAVPVGSPFPDIAQHVVQAKGIGPKTSHGRGEGMAVVAAQGPVLPARPEHSGVGVERVGGSQQALGIVAAGIAGVGAGPAGVFPLGFCGQAVAHAFLLAQPGGQGHGVVPGDIEDRVCIVLDETRVLPGVAGIAPLERITAPRGGRVVGGVVAVASGAIGHGFGHIPRSLDKLAKLAHRHLMLPQVKRPRDPNPVHRRLVTQLGQTAAFVARKGLGQHLDGLVAAHQKFAGRNTHQSHAQTVFNGLPGRVGVRQRTG